MPRITNLLVSGPGELVACLGEFSVDGGVVLNKNLDLLGFVVEMLVDAIDKPGLDLCFINDDGVQVT